ncbi:hypothetical protein [Rivularia sp. UHCC 0363]|uniref:hypothetical protein n=1 Tax=Rivularia sp. UHCC 0363 TaxID=3110244 RepID=UPI002B1F6ADC|nr:hypothetical protein [Rivularia sp. UHCC 0363]MEA5595673.1 hypothetical protein [Rivularia sp. UHCC 0363]
MDTPEDFQFLTASVVQQHNPYQEGEYLVIKTYPREKRLCCVHRSFDYSIARNKRDLENLAHDYSSFGLRVFHQGKLYQVINSGEPGIISKQQDWKIHPDYEDAHYDQNAEGEIIVCDCSYPYFSALVSYSSLCNEPIAESQPLTCLVDDEGREIDNCPNCGGRLIIDYEDEEDWEEDYIPTACEGCSNYHGQFYNRNLLVCAIHPHGFDSKSCPDFTS